MPELEILDDELSARGANPRARGLNRLQFDTSPSAAAPKELFAETRDLAWGSHFIMNMPRAVMETVRQFEPPVADVNAGHFSDLVNLVLSRFTDLEDRATPVRPSSRTKLNRPIARRILELFRDAESHGHAAEFESSLNAWLAATADCSTGNSPFIEQAKHLDKRGRTDAALDLVYDQIDEMLLAGHFSEVDRLLATVSVPDLSMNLLLALLTATLPAKKRLAVRDRFFSNVEETLRQRNELKDGLLVGLD